METNGKIMGFNVKLDWRYVKETIRNNINGKYAYYRPMMYDNKLDYRNRSLMQGRCEGLLEALFIVLSCFDVAEQILKDMQEAGNNEKQREI